MDYLEIINDPLKIYFKEKIGNLYINADVIKLLTDKGQKGEGQQLQKLTDSFLNYSNPTESEKPTNKLSRAGMLEKSFFRKHNGKSKRKSSIELYEKARLKKRAEIHGNINTVVGSHTDTGINRLDQNFDQFNDNNIVVKSNLDLQSSTIECKLYARKQRSIIKGEIIRFA